MTVLWYVHDHGAGHLQRARCVVPLLGVPAIVAGGPGVHDQGRATFGDRFVALPSDVPDQPTPTPGPWHHAPPSAAVRARSEALARAVAEHGCTTAVVDVSMEVTVLMRLLGLRVITLRQSGRRDDPAHVTGLASADAVWVPQCRHLEPSCGADERWRFTGPFSLLDQSDRPRGVRRPDLAVLLVGRGGHRLDLDAWRSAAAPTGWRVVIAGDRRRWAGGDVESVGEVDPIGPLLDEAAVVVTSAGWASVADVVASGARLVVVPEPRPFDEQVVRTDALSRAGLAVRCERWPTPDELAGVLDRAAELRPCAWHAVHDGNGARRAARLVEEVHRS